MKKKFYISGKGQRKVQMISGILFVIMSFTVLAFHIWDENKTHFPFLFVLYLFQGATFIYYAINHYNETSISLNEQTLSIKWNNSVRSEKLNIQSIKNIDISRMFLEIKSNNGNKFKYVLADFDNNKRKELLLFLRELLNDKLTVNNKSQHSFHS